MGFLSALKEWGDSISDFYANPRLSLHRPTSEAVRSRFSDIQSWLNVNADYGIIVPHSKLSELEALIDDFQTEVLNLKQELDMAPARFCSMPHLIGDKQIFLDAINAANYEMIYTVKQFQDLINTLKVKQ